jgi:hypothetical protein
MKIWCILNRNSANRCRESCALWSSFPVAWVIQTFLGKLLEKIRVDMDRRIKISISILEIAEKIQT